MTKAEAHALLDAAKQSRDYFHVDEINNALVVLGDLAADEVFVHRHRPAGTWESGVKATPASVWAGLV
jgi:hypothetical protein